MIRRTATLTFVFLLLAGTGFAQVKLEHKLTEGLKFTQELISTIDQTLTIAGNETETKVEVQTMAEATIGKRDEDGKLPVKEKIKSLQVSIKGTAGEYRFDSANPDDRGGSQLELLREVHKALASRTVTTVYGKDNRVAEIKCDGDLLLSKVSEFDPEYLKEIANQGLDVIPSNPVKKGDSWERTAKVDLGAGQMMQFKTNYTYEGTVEKDGQKLDKISSKTLSVEFSLADDSPLPISLKESKLKVKESKGVVLFDRKLGRIVESKETIRVAGGLTFVANGQELPSELDLKMETEIALKR